MREQIDLRVRFVDTDASGRIHFTSAFRWVEAAEFELFRSRGVDPTDLVAYPRREVHCEYVRMLRFDDEITVEIAVERVGTSSITFRWSGGTAGEVAFHGGHTIVRVDEVGRPAPIDDHIRRALSD